MVYSCDMSDIECEEMLIDELMHQQTYVNIETELEKFEWLGGFI